MLIGVSHFSITMYYIYITCVLLLIYHCIKDIYHFRTSFIRVIFFIICVVCKVHSALSTRYICVCKQIMNSCYDGTIYLCVYIYTVIT